MILELSKEELNNLSVEQLVSRMDALLEANELERYGVHFQFNRPSVRAILNTKHVQEMCLEKQRAVCHLVFNTLLQMEYSQVAAAASNSLVYGPNFNERESWKSVKVQVNRSALIQFEIISSRIVMECFMELLHYLGEGKRIRASKSTFHSFKKWLNNPQNPFAYFATHVLRAFVFDRNFRTPEVHASSRLNNHVLRMKIPTSEDNNSPLELTNVMLNVWQPLVDILNDGKSYSMHGSEEDFKWLKSYLHDDAAGKAQFLESIFKQMQ